MRQPPNRQKLTALFLQKVKPKPTPFMVWDSYQRGLALRVEPTGYKSWKAIYRHGNRPRWLHLGAADAIPLTEARRLAAEAMIEVARGKDPQAERKAQRMTGTFQELHERYVNEWAKRRNKSWKQAHTLVRKHLLPSWAKLSAQAITRSDVRAMMGRITSPILANQVLAAGSAVFTWAVAQEIVTTNPCRGVERNETKSRERVLTDAEVPAFWAAFNSGGLVQSCALKVILLTGQRPGEVAHMRMEHVSDGWWTMPGAPDAKLGWPGTKNKQTHRVWLPQTVQDIIAELTDGEATGFVFPNSRRGAIDGLDVVMRDICKQLAAPRATPHDLRRTHGTKSAELGFGREAMNRVQNHREGGIADVYDRHEYSEENKRVMEAVASHIMVLATGAAAASNVVSLR